MQKRPEQIEALTRVCVDDLLSAFGLGGLRRGRRLLELLSRVPAQRVARQIANYDQIVGESGLRAGGAWALERMVRRVEIEGRERVPTEGSLLLLSNHPGLADAVALFSCHPEAGPARGRSQVATSGRAPEHLAVPDHGSEGFLEPVRGPEVGGPTSQAWWCGSELSGWTHGARPGSAAGRGRGARALVDERGPVRTAGPRPHRRSRSRSAACSPPSPCATRSPICVIERRTAGGSPPTFRCSCPRCATSP